MTTPKDGVEGAPAHSKSEYKRRVALGDPNVLPPKDGVGEVRAPNPGLVELLAWLEGTKAPPPERMVKALRAYLTHGVGGTDG